MKTTIELGPARFGCVDAVGLPPCWPRGIWTPRSGELLFKAKRQYQLTCKVSRYYRSALQGSEHTQGSVHSRRPPYAINNLGLTEHQQIYPRSFTQVCEAKVNCLTLNSASKTRVLFSYLISTCSTNGQARVVSLKLLNLIITNYYVHVFSKHETHVKTDDSIWANTCNSPRALLHYYSFSNITVSWFLLDIVNSEKKTYSVPSLLNVLNFFEAWI